MERLTWNDSNQLKVCGSEKCNGKCSICQPMDEAIEKLKAYEDAEEQGLLLRLPCKVGDTVYLVDFEEKAYDEATVWSIEIDTKDNRILINSDYEVGTWAENGYLFYSREEAEQALKQIGE